MYVKVNEMYRIMNHSVDEQVDCFKASWTGVTKVSTA